MTISPLWDLYRENLEGLSSQASDTSRFTNYLKPHFGSKEPHEILSLDIVRLRRKVLAANLALFNRDAKGELLKLEWSDIDYENGLILIRSPKGNRSMHIPMNDRVRSMLKNHPRA